MRRSVRLLSVLGCASLLLVFSAPTVAAQVTDHAADALARMRADLSARRYAAVITQANGLLESARAISTPQRLEIWQLLAAAYFPNAPRSQHPDSARLPLEALIRLAPDFKIARELSWSGLDELVERIRIGSFAVASRPLPEYSLSASSPGQITVVASRPTRFRLTSVHEGSGRTVVHDSSTFGTIGALQLRTHDARGPIFTNGSHRLDVWAYDSVSGDSMRVVHRVRAFRNDLPAPIADPSVSVAIPAEPVERSADRVLAPTRRASTLWGGLALAAATAVIAQEARPNDGMRSAFRVDARAFVVGATMAGAAVANFFTSRAPRRPAATAHPVIIATPPPTIDTYRVRLVIDTAGR